MHVNVKRIRNNRSTDELRMLWLHGMSLAHQDARYNDF